MGEIHPNSFINLLPKNLPLIVRSSSKWEDTETISNAGAYLSISDVNINSIEEAVLKVFASYSDHLAEDQILIQVMLKNLVRSGVAFSHEQSSGSPYKTINWQDGDDSSYVTSGQGGRYGAIGESFKQN